MLHHQSHADSVIGAHMLRPLLSDVHALGPGWESPPDRAHFLCARVWVGGGSIPPAGFGIEEESGRCSRRRPGRLGEAKQSSSCSRVSRGTTPPGAVRGAQVHRPMNPYGHQITSAEAWPQRRPGRKVPCAVFSVSGPGIWMSADAFQSLDGCHFPFQSHLSRSKLPAPPGGEASGAPHPRAGSTPARDVLEDSDVGRR